MNKTLTSEYNDILYKIKVLLVEGCTVQGGHHKAWYLDQLARMILMDDAYDILSKLDDWDKGIAP